MKGVQIMDAREAALEMVTMNRGLNGRSVEVNIRVF